MIFVNFKTYEEGSGENAAKLVSILEEVSAATSVKIIPVVQASDLKEISQKTLLELWAQHIDPVEFGAHTGAILAQAVKEDGAQGTFLNHSENKFKNFEDLKKAVDLASKVGLKTLVFAKDLKELNPILGLKPSFVAFEPPELIGSRDRSVASEKPELITRAFNLAKAQGIPLIVGAGIHGREDIKTSLKLGASGFAVASDILKADNPKKELEDLIEGYN